MSTASLGFVTRFATVLEKYWFDTAMWSRSTNESCDTCAMFGTPVLEHGGSTGGMTPSKQRGREPRSMSAMHGSQCAAGSRTRGLVVQLLDRDADHEHRQRPHALAELRRGPEPTH